MVVESRVTDFELAAVIERELAGLPDHSRLAVALCDLDGRSRTEAAEVLGVPEGTLSSRLNTARKRLAERLSRCGYGAGVLTTLATASRVTANVPWPLIETTTDSSTGVVGPNILSITEGVIRTMNTKWKLLSWVLPAMTAVAVIGTATIVTAQTAPPVKAPPKAAEVEKADPDSPGAKKVSDAPPVVVKTVPAAGAEDVDPATKEVSVTFSKAMTDQSWSWAIDLGRGAALPSGDNKPAFDKDKKTCSLAVKLEPNTTYAVWLNGGEFMNFKDADGTASLPYLLVFRTGNSK